MFGYIEGRRDWKFCAAALLICFTFLSLFFTRMQTMAQMMITMAMNAQKPSLKRNSVSITNY